MKHASMLCCLTLVLGCATRPARLGPEPPSGQIGTGQLMEAFITYVQKAEGGTVDQKKQEQMRRELQEVKDDPLLAPYVFEDAGCNRRAIMDRIAQARVKWLSSDIPLSRTANYAFEPSNLEALSDAELVMAMRLVEQTVSKLKSQVDTQ